MDVFKSFVLRSVGDMFRDGIRKQTKSLLSNYPIKRGYPPVNVWLLAKELNYPVYQASFRNENISGGITFNAYGNGKIYVNHNDSSFRQRFTIAHEISHAVLHSEKYKQNGILEQIDMFRTGRGTGNELELEANEFTVALLMPENLVRKYWSHWGLLRCWQIFSKFRFRLCHIAYISSS